MRAARIAACWAAVTGGRPRARPASVAPQKVSPAPVGAVQVLPGHLAGPRVIAFTLLAERVDVPLARLVVELTSEGRPTAMLVPITLLNGDLLPAADDIH